MISFISLPLNIIVTGSPDQLQKNNFRDTINTSYHGYIFSKLPCARIHGPDFHPFNALCDITSKDKAIYEFKNRVEETKVVFPPSPLLAFQLISECS